MSVRTAYRCPKCGTNLYIMFNTMKEIKGQLIPDEMSIMCPHDCNLMED